MKKTPQNPLIQHLPSIGLMLGVLFGCFIGLLFKANLGMAMMIGIIAGVALGGLVRLIATVHHPSAKLEDSDLINPEYLN
ncbi:hypothetical protein QP938_02225 [Porticoccaceae bacterium LTM1]|nr:hypothetical protein QP938_02225 [Porticoccaceae bacterium LTM1]